MKEDLFVEGIFFSGLILFSFWVLFFSPCLLLGLSSCLVASVAFWWLLQLFGFSGFCIRLQVSRGPEYGSKASEKTRGEQEAIKKSSSLPVLP